MGIRPQLDTIVERIMVVVITDTFRDEQTKDAATPYLGKADEIRYRFGENVLQVKRGSNGNEIQVFLEDEDTAKTPEKTTRVWQI